DTSPISGQVTVQFPARGKRPAAAVTWYEGSRDGKLLTPPDDLLKKVLGPQGKLSASGCLLAASKGLLHSPPENGEVWKLIGEGLDDEAKKVNETLPRNGRGD